jgi:hypothetical protein
MTRLGRNCARLITKGNPCQPSICTVNWFGPWKSVSRLDSSFAFPIQQLRPTRLFDIQYYRPVRDRVATHEAYMMFVKYDVMTRLGEDDQLNDKMAFGLQLQFWAPDSIFVMVSSNALTNTKGFIRTEFQMQSFNTIRTL